MNTCPSWDCPVILSIAGSDSSSGAGIQADLKAASALGAYALTTVTCVVSEVPGKVSRIQAIEPAVIMDQIELSLAHFPVKAVKTGMLYSPDIVRNVADILRKYQLPLVIDPVMIASSGDPLMQQEAIQAYSEYLLPLASVVTPNMDETAVLQGKRPQNLDDNRKAAGELAKRYNTAFLVKGGHLEGLQNRTDVLCLANGQSHEWEGPWFEDVSTHGTGCTYSAAIAAGLAYGLSLPDAVGQAHALVARSIKHHFRWNAPGMIDALNPLVCASE